MTNPGSAVEVRHPMTLLGELERSGALTPTSLRLPGDITTDEYEAVGRMLAAARDTLQWLVGDFILHGETIWGEESYQYVDVLKISEASKSQYSRVASRIPPGRRIESLSWSHHREVAPLEEEDQDRMLRAAASNGWTRRELADEIADLKPPVEPASGYVVEAVLDAAEAIWNEHGDLLPEGGRMVYGVSIEAMENLGRALGKAE